MTFTEFFLLREHHECLVSQCNKMLFHDLDLTDRATYLCLCKRRDEAAFILANWSKEYKNET